ncbi:MAG: extracellular solute-binding protein [Anaerolineales bacterium]
MRYTAVMLSKMSLIALVVSLAACSEITFPFPIGGSATLIGSTPTATIPPTASVAPSTPTPPANQLTVWLPPQFAPEAETPGGEVLAQQLAEFQQTRGITVTVRLKAETGRGGLLDSLLAAYNVAPAVLPEVIALSRDDLAAAAAAGAVTPLDGLILPEVLTQAYPFAQALSRVDGRWVGAPFVAEARLAVYHTGVYSSAPVRWSDIVTGTFIFPGTEATGLTLLNDYLAREGPLLDEQGQPALNVPLLTSLFTQLQTAREAGQLPLATLSYTDTLSTWQAFRDRRATLALTSTRWYMAEAGRVEQSAAMLPPTLQGTAFTLADGWCWALVNKGSDSARAAELLNWLTTPARLAEWTRAARVLPPRADTLAAWDTDAFSPLAAALLTNAQLQPPAAVLDRLGPLLVQALDDVLNNRATPEAAARAVAQTYLSEP